MGERHEILADLLQVVNRAMFELIKDALREHGLPITSMAVLRQIHGEPGITVSEIARRTEIVKSHVSKTIDHLARQGLVEKRPDPSDQRLVRVYATEQVAGHLGQLRAAVARRLSAVVAAVPEEQVDALIQGLQILKSVLGQGKGC